MTTPTATGRPGQPAGPGRPTNWAGNVTFSAERVHRPDTVQTLRRLVAERPRLRALGTGHSFNRLADTPGDLVSLAALPPVFTLDAQARRVTVGAGLRYGDLVTRLHAAGWALHNLASLPHISVAGACATGTHGSGDRNGNLATAVRALKLVTGEGELVTLDRDGDPDTFPGAVVALGALGVVTELTLDLVPAFEVRQYVYDDLPRAALAEHFDEVFGSGYSVSLFTDWTGPRINQVWRKCRAEDPAAAAPPARWLGATLATGARHPVPGMPAGNCTDQLGVPGPWHARLPHFRLEFTPSHGEELQSEYVVARRHALAALAALDDIRDDVARVLQISEIRTVAADELWLSPNYRRDSVAIHFTWIADAGAVLPVVAAVERQLAPFAPRPHWGKLFGIPPRAVAREYERLPDFRRLARRYDPTGRFGNELLEPYLSAGAESA